MTVRLYFADLDRAETPDQHLIAMLTPAEQARRHATVSTVNRRRWSLGRALLRSLIGLRDATTDLATTANGKPFHKDAPHFSPATSANFLLVGVSDVAPIGVDVELVRDVAFPANWASVYPALAAMRGEDRSDVSNAVRFLRAWTRLEAITKRDGDRLGRALDPLNQPNRPEHGSGCVSDVEISVSVIAAVAGFDDEIELRRIDPDNVLAGW